MIHFNFTYFSKAGGGYFSALKRRKKLKCFFVVWTRVSNVRDDALASPEIEKRV